VEVLVHINASEDETADIKNANAALHEQLMAWIESHQDEKLRFFALFDNALPAKKAGVGLARKIAMDEAVARFDAIGVDGTIVCLDADTTCQPNYLESIHRHFSLHTSSPAASIHFEHPLNGAEFESSVYEGIVRYELFLRYFRHALRFVGHPHSIYTVGSAMVVRSSAYQKQGGMNKRQAGEDFYFLQKMMPLGGFSEIIDTTVYPSPRPSDRVPFGTGRAISKWLNEENDAYLTYDLNSFLVLKPFFEQTTFFYSASEVEMESQIQSYAPALKAFLTNERAVKKMVEVRANCRDQGSFEKRFFLWFNGFVVLKYMHFARDGYYPLKSLLPEASILLETMNEKGSGGSPRELLNTFRILDKKA